MQRNIKDIVRKNYDLLIIGGGIFGACAAWDATLRGLSVAIIEKEDFCSGTSANSFKMVHGGIRYLQHADIKRLRSSCHERSAMLRIAPHLVRPLPILIPTYGYGKSGKAFLGAGMLVYDLLTWDRNQGIRDKDRHIPLTKFLNRSEVLEEYPDIDPNGLTGGALFYDGQMYNPTRLVLAFIKSAQENGAHVANYVEARQLIREGNKIIGVEAHDNVSNETIRINSRIVLNAAGPWSEWLLDSSFSSENQKGTYSRDACFVIKRRFDSTCALAVQGRTKDPDAVLARPARHLFLVPWRNYTLVGVWHVVWKRHPDEVTVTEEEVSSFIDEINWAYPALKLTTKDVVMWNAGLVPFGDNDDDAENLSYGKRSHLTDHKLADGLDGLVTLIGIRYTTARGDSAKAIDIVCKKLGKNTTRAATDFKPVSGGDIADFDGLVEKTFRNQNLGLTSDCVRAITHNHGTCASDVFKLVEQQPWMADTLGDTQVLKAEVVYAARNEMAQTLGDVVFRRTDLATGGNPGIEVLGECANILATELSWGETRVQDEIAKILQRFPDWIATCPESVTSLGHSAKILDSTAA